MSNLIKKKYIDQITSLQEVLMNTKDKRVFKGKDLVNITPLKHSFSDGIYTREMFLPKDTFAIGKIHKFNHTWFLLKGSLLIATQDGVEKIVAPFQGNSKAGIKRAVYALEDSVFVNVFPNSDNLKDINELEKAFVVETPKEFKEFLIKNK